MSESLVDSVLTRDIRARIAADTAEGTGLPNLCYTSDEWLKLENERVFARTWMLAGFCHDIPNPGDACPVTVAGMPILLVRDAAGEVRAFHNVCRHRGAMLLERACSGLKGLTCPYHSWSYGLDGRLKARPNFFGSGQHDHKPPAEAPAMIPVRHAIWHDLIFVNISGDAVDFDKHWAPFAERTEKYDFGALRYAKTLNFDVSGNWKLIYENAFDTYHIPTLHPSFYSFFNITDAPEFEGAWLYGTSRVPESEERGFGLPLHRALDDETRRTEWFFILFPTSIIQIFTNHLAVFQLDVLAPGRTLERIHLYFVENAAFDSTYEKPRQDVYDMWNKLNPEDFGVVESMRRARHSCGFDGGALAPYWDPAIQHFARLTSEAIG